MVEVIIAMVVLAFGLLGMAGTTALVVRQVTLADLATERSAVVQTTLERLRSLPFDSVRSGTATHGIFSAQWAVASPTNQWKTVRLITTGPGMTTGAGGFPVMGRSVPDTMVYRIVRPGPRRRVAASPWWSSWWWWCWGDSWSSPSTRSSSRTRARSR